MIYRSGAHPLASRVVIARRILLRTGAASALVFGLAPETATAAPAERLRISRNRLYVPARIAGRPVEALLDSAAELTLVDKAFAARAGIAGGAKATARGSGAAEVDSELVDGVSIAAFGVKINRGQVAIVDLSDVASRLTDGPLNVILGRDVFDQARLSVDISHRSIRVLDRAILPRGLEFPLTPQFGIETMPVDVEGQSARATVDLGNGTDVLVSPAFAGKLGALVDGRPLTRDTGGGIGGAASRTGFHIHTLRVANHVFHDVPATIDAGKNATDLNIGISILRRFRLVLDFSEQKIWLD